MNAWGDSWLAGAWLSGSWLEEQFGRRSGRVDDLVDWPPASIVVRGIGSGEAFGATVLRVGIAVAAIESGEAFGEPSLVALRSGLLRATRAAILRRGSAAAELRRAA